MIIYFESRRTTLVAIRTGRSRTGRTWRSCSRTLTGPTTCPGSGRLGRKRRPGCRRNWRSRPRSRWPDRAAPPYGSGAGDESSAPFFLGPPCDCRVSTITCFAPIVKLQRCHLSTILKGGIFFHTPTGPARRSASCLSSQLCEALHRIAGLEGAESLVVNHVFELDASEDPIRSFLKRLHNS